MDKFTWEIGATIAGILSFTGVLINIVLTASQSKKQRTAEIITRNRVEWMQKFKEYIAEYNEIVCYYHDRNTPEDLDEYFNRLNNITLKIKLHLNFSGKNDKIIISEIEMLNKSWEKFLQLTKDKEANNNANRGKLSKDIVEFYLTNYPDIGEKVTSSILLEGKKSKKNKEDLLKLILNKEDYYNEFCKQYVKHIDKDLKSCIKKIQYGPELINILVQIYLKTEWERVKKESVNGKAKKFNFDKEYEELKKDINDEIERLTNLMK